MKPFRLLLFAVFFAGSLSAQVCVKGHLSNDTLHTAVSNATVFIPELSRSAISDASGNYSLCGLPKGTFTLQVKCLGYRTQVKTILLSDSIFYLTIPLTLTSIEYPEVVVYGDQIRKSEETPNTITSISNSQMRENGAISLSDGISKLPGASQLSTGAGISKPVIRGLFGNRIQTVVMGMRFDNQQWQDEHGLGLTDIGVDRIEVIKGPSSLLYGSEAMGGVLNVIEEKPAPIGLVKSDYSIRAFSNTLGYAVDAGASGAEQKINWRLRLGKDSHADYSDGNGKRILNSRFNDYNVKSGFGYTGKNWTSVNQYLFSKSNFGFLMEAFQLSLPADRRLSRSFDMPHHTVYVNMLTSQNTFFLKESKIKLNLGAHFNNRQEQEGGSKISLNMLLNTFTGNLVWVRDLGEHTEFNLGSQGMFQSNKNIGSRMIVPDAKTLETSFYGYLRHSRKYFAAEGGIRYDLRNLQTFATGDINTSLNNPGTNIVPFSKLYQALNGSAGISLFDTKHWNLKGNLSSGYRSGNLAELSSNGLHEGTLRYEIGNVDMKIEQNLCGDAYMAYDSKEFKFSVSVYENRFMNYIYLAPTSDQYIGYPIFRYVQKDATLKGSEVTAVFHPIEIKWLELGTTFAQIEGITSDKENLPFIPANKISTSATFHLNDMKKIRRSFFKVGADYIASQDHPGQFETATPTYSLLNAGAGCTIKNRGHQIELSVSGNNLLDKVYYDHLSRFKYFGIYNMGRSITLNFKMSFKELTRKEFFFALEDIAASF